MAELTPRSTCLCDQGIGEGSDPLGGVAIPPDDGRETGIASPRGSSSSTTLRCPSTSPADGETFPARRRQFAADDTQNVVALPGPPGSTQPPIYGSDLPVFETPVIWPYDSGGR